MLLIDWKLLSSLIRKRHGLGKSHHSLVTPIDWKLIRFPSSGEDIEDRSPLFGDTY